MLTNATKRMTDVACRQRRARYVVRVQRPATHYGMVTKEYYKAAGIHPDVRIASLEHV